MSDVDTTIFALQRNWDMVSTAVDGVDDDILKQMPNDESNSMAWLVWHMTRVADRFIHARFQETGPVVDGRRVGTASLEWMPTPRSSVSAGVPSRSQNGAVPRGRS